MDVKVTKYAVRVTDPALLCGHQALPVRKGQRLMTSTGLGEMGFGLPDKSRKIRK